MSCRSRNCRANCRTKARSRRSRTTSRSFTTRSSSRRCRSTPNTPPAAAPPKLVVLNNALLAATDPLGPPTCEADPARFGTWLENAVLAHAINSGHDVRYRREEPHEVDGVLDGPWGHWALEVKSGPFSAQDLRGLFEFCTRFPAYRPLVVCADALGVEVARSAGAQATTWSGFLLEGPGAQGSAQGSLADD